jgi:hypothetical protein
LWLYLSSSWVDYIEGINDVLYAEGASELGYIEGTSEGIYIEGAYNRMYTRSRNKVVYIEFISCYCSVLLITENKLIYTPSKINIG